MKTHLITAPTAVEAHTPGPWLVSFNGSDDVRVFAESVGDRPRAICKVNAPLNRGLETAANARLIAAAPDLLAALKLAAVVITREVRAGRCPSGLENTVNAAIAAAIIS